ncbi:MAG: hypothetical protein ABSA78_20535 [Candidatus Sulfotelmatobacter sp.]|jgi:FlaG/FlaF family flagellin (archaellin)
MFAIGVSRLCVRKRLTYLLPVLLIGLPAAAQSVTITSPTNNSTNPSAVQITAHASNEPSSFDHYEIWDTSGSLGGYKLGTVPKTSTPNAVYVLPNGTHTLSVLAVTAAGGSGGVLNQASVTFTVAESCTDSSTVQCNLDQLGIQNPQSNCDPPQEALWVGNPCGAQGGGSTEPESISISQPTESNPIPDGGDTTLNGKSLLLSETPSGPYSNVIFIAYSPTTTGSTTDSHWVLDEYVYLPDPAANQSLELDAYYVIDSVWTSFTTQCAFIYNGGPGYWAVYGGNGGWAYLNGTNGAPNVPCTTSLFSTPWPNSTDPSFTGWHHIVWNFVRNDNSNGNGYVTYTSLKFDGTTYTLNYTPTYETPGSGSNNGDFAALVQLDGTSNASLSPQVYVNELNITHTP